MKRATVILVTALFLALTFPVHSPGADWFRATAVTDVSISTTRSDVTNGWSFIIKQYGGSDYIFGSIMDNQNDWQSTGYTGNSALMLTINQLTASEVGIVAGDYLTVTFDGQTGYVFLPAVPWYQRVTTLYLSDDWCSYTDTGLTAKAASTPSPSPTPTAIPKTPTPVPTATARVPSPTPTPVTHEVGIVEFSELDANPSSATLATDGSESRFYMKGDQMVLQFNPSSSLTWYYVLDLTSGVTDGITWTGQTTEP